MAKYEIITWWSKEDDRYLAEELGWEIPEPKGRLMYAYWKNRKTGKRREQFRRPFVMTSFHILSVFGIDFYRDTANALFDDLAVIKDALFNGV